VPDVIEQLRAPSDAMQELDIAITAETAQLAVASDPRMVARPRSRATRTPRRCRSPPTAAAATATVRACGSLSCNSSPTRPAFRSASATSRPAPRSEPSRFDGDLQSRIRSWREGLQLVSRRRELHAHEHARKRLAVWMVERFEHRSLALRHRGHKPAGRSQPPWLRRWCSRGGQRRIGSCRAAGPRKGLMDVRRRTLLERLSSPGP
jgi:hypothetical protein